MGVLPAHRDLIKRVATSAGFRKTGHTFYGEIECVQSLLTTLTGYQIPCTLSPDFVAHCSAVIEECESKGDNAFSQVTEMEKLGDFTLWPFQRDNVRKMAEAKSILNCDAPGLGKTCQSLMTLPPGEGALVACPKGVTGDWTREVRGRRGDLTVTSLRGSQAFRMPLPGEVLLVSYDSIPPLKSEAKKGLDLEDVTKGVKEPIRLIADEIHYLKNYSSARTKRFRHLAGVVLKKGGHVIGLTGTPLINKPGDFWCILMNLGLAKQCFGSWDNYVKVMGGYKNRWGAWEWAPRRNESSLHEVLSKCVIRHTLEEVLPEMPAKIKSDYPIVLEDSVLSGQLDQVMKEFEGLSDEEIYAILQQEGFASLARVREKLAVIKAKGIEPLVDSLEEYGEPIIVTSFFKRPVELFGSRKGWGLITGETDSPARDRIKEEFRSGKLKGLAMTIRSSAEGINLQTCNRMIFIDRDYTVAKNQQVEARIYRIGQTRPCYYQYAMIDHPVEYRISEILEEKGDMADSLIEPIALTQGRNKTKSQQLRDLLTFLPGQQ